MSPVRPERRRGSAVRASCRVWRRLERQVGAGAMGGLAVLGLAPGLMSAGVMNVALRDDPALASPERTARSVGR